MSQSYYNAIILVVAICVSSHHFVHATFKVAVYNQAELLTRPSTTPSRAEAVAILTEQLDIYRQIAVNASLQGCALVVFPEYGLMPMRLGSREKTSTFMEQLPDPTQVQWNPCQEPLPESGTPDPLAVQRALSCAAANNQLYIVANIGEKASCDPVTDPTCPPDGQFQYNTNVAYDPAGVLVARYRKYHLFMSETKMYDVPATAEAAFFQTPYGVVGTFTCFDIIFDEPAVTLTRPQLADVRHVAFPTAWMNELPYYAAGPFHQSFAASRRVNLFAANIHHPYFDFYGSGVYGWDGQPRAFRGDYNNVDHSSQLIVAEVPDGPGARPDSSYTPQPLPVPGMTPDFNGPLFFDEFSFVRLTPGSGTKSVCNGGLCCMADFTFDETADMFALGAFKGLHTVEGEYYMEICIVMLCQYGNATYCGEDATTSTTYFDFLNITANFSTPYAYPQVVTTGVPADDEGTWQFYPGSGQATLTVAQRAARPLLSATMYARRFDLDAGGYDNGLNEAARTLSSTVTVPIIFIMVTCLVAKI